MSMRYLDGADQRFVATSDDTVVITLSVS
jgi:hypothetical protein